MAHKKSLLGKYFSESDCRSPRHDGHNWLIPETSLSEPSGEDRSGKTTEVMKSGSTSTDTNVTNKSGSTSTDTNVTNKSGSTSTDSDVTIQSGSTTPDSDVTIIVTSTPVKEKPLPLRFSNFETMSGETLPSEIFGSPDRDKQSPSKSPDSSSDDILNANLQTMRNVLHHSQQKQKKKRFFQQMLQGKNNFYLLNNLINSQKEIFHEMNQWF